MSFTVHIHFTEKHDAFRFIGEMINRFGPEPVDLSEYVDDEATADDIELMHKVQTIIGNAGSAETARTELSNLIPLYGKSNDQMRYLDSVIGSLSEFVEPDQAPPEGITMLDEFAAPDFPRPKTQGGSDADKRGRAMVRGMVRCPTCGAGVGQYCRGGNKVSYGNHTMHEARLDEVFGPRS